MNFSNKKDDITKTKPVAPDIKYEYENFTGTKKEYEFWKNIKLILK